MAYTNAANIIDDGFQDTEDLDGLFSGFDPETGHYDPTSWHYEPPGAPDDRGAAAHERAVRGRERGSAARKQSHQAAQSEAHGSGGAPVSWKGRRDETLQHPRCVFQILKRHFARYTPEMVQEVCGISPEQFAQVADALTRNSGRERTTAFCYAVGWTHHSVGAQMIRTAAILQTLLGNIGRPGGGIMALRGHASIQGSTDIPTLFNILPGYLPMPQADQHQSLDEWVARRRGQGRLLGQHPVLRRQPAQGLLGRRRDRRERLLLRLPAAASPATTRRTPRSRRMIEGRCKGYFLVGENPAVGSANGKMQRLGLANLDWLVVRDLQMIESATFWKDGPEIETGELVTEEIGTEVFFLPAASHVEKAGSFTQTQRMLQWRDKAVDPPGDCRSELQFYVELGNRIREKLADSTDEMDRPLLDLAWDYPRRRAAASRTGSRCCARSTAPGPTARRSRRTPS